MLLVSLFVIDHLDVVVVAVSQREILSEKHKGVVECLIQDGDFEDAGGGNVGLAFDFAGEGRRGLLSARDDGKGGEDESEGKAEHVELEGLERRRRGFQAKAGVPAN